MTDVWQAPGPGSWQLDDAHVVGAATGFFAALFPPSFMQGWADGFSNYGALIERIDMAMVGGRMYVRIKPVGAPEPKEGKVQKPPPKFVMRALCTLHPELRRRGKAAASVIANRSWREDRVRWRTEYAPVLRKRLIELQSVDPASLDNEGLSSHLDALVGIFDEGNALHFRQNPASIFPVGDFVAQTCEWTSCDPAEAVACLQGSNPSSAGNVALLDALVDKIRTSKEATSAVTGNGDADARLARLRSVSSGIAQALDAYLDEYGNHIVTGFDVSDRTMLEMPATIVSSIVSRLEKSEDARGGVATRAEDAAFALRERVPADKRSAFDEVLREARAAYGLHDEDVGICYLWPLGLIRRALQESGRRLLSTGAIANVEHVFEATPDEIGALLAHAPDAPTNIDLASRAAQREEWSALDAPKFLGPQMEPPSPDAFSPALGRMMRGMMTYIADANFARERIPADQLRGVAASGGVYEGRACVVCSPDEFDSLQPGDVLIAPTTSPAYNVVLPFIGAVVTDRGGALSHAAIVAREFGIPAVVGTVDASRIIRTGAKVRVDGSSGVVELIGT